MIRTKLHPVFHKAIIFLLAVTCMAIVSLLFLTMHTYAGNADCGGIETSFDYGCPDDTDREAGDVERSPLFHLLLVVTNILAVGVGIAAVGSITWGAIKYASSDGSPEKVKEGISWILNAVTGLLLFLAMYALINFLVPGGLFSQSDTNTGTFGYEVVYHEKND